MPDSSVNGEMVQDALRTIERLWARTDELGLVVRAHVAVTHNGELCWCGPTCAEVYPIPPIVPAWIGDDRAPNHEIRRHPRD